MRPPRSLVAAVCGLVALACTEAPGVAPAADREPLAEGIELSRQGRLQESAASLERAVELFADDSGELPIALNELSDVRFRLGEFEEQEAVLWRALEAGVTVGDRKSQATSWNNLGVSFAARGRPSAALEAYQHCLDLRRDVDDRTGAAATRHNLGVQLLLIGRVPEGVEELRQALADRRRLNDPTAVGQTLASLAWGLSLSGQETEALAAYAEAVALLEQGRAVHDLSIALEQRSQLHRAAGRLGEARRDLERSAALLSEDGEPPPLDSAYLQLGLGSLERLAATSGGPGHRAAAAALLQFAVDSFDQLGAQEGRILARLELARWLRSQPGGAEEAVWLLEAAIEIVETARADLRLPSFRATFLGGWQAVYQELVDLLAWASLEATRSQRRTEARALASRALEVSERARARALLDRLGGGAGGAGIASKPIAAASQADAAPPEVLRREVERLETEALQAPGSTGGRAHTERGSSASITAARAALRQARVALERHEEVWRRTAEPASPVATPADVESIRRQLDTDTVLLVYALAPRRSWLWRVDRDTVTIFPLPHGREIEAAAREAHELLPLSDRPGYRKAAGASLHRLALLTIDPVKDLLAAERLTIVPDGALHLVPFSALPMPSPEPGSGAESKPAERVPLGAGHEIVQLPSASTLVALRRRADRNPAPDLLAIVADPVFEASDPRLRTIRTPVPQTAQSPSSFQRLPATADEAAAIAAIARRATGASPPVYLGFDAHRERVLAGDLDHFRILHFATHGVVDTHDAALGGLLLALFTAEGQPRDGLLRSRDLYDLRLSADLVVLSACRSALGREIRGEGLVGLADGFFAAGARQLVVSLWEVDDRATAELMRRFYHHLLLDGDSPSGALRHAQSELRERTAWRSPAYWAAFILLGDG